MRLKAYRNYIDELGNISETKAIFKPNGKKHKKKLKLILIDNINNKKKQPIIGKSEFEFGYNGKLYGVLENSPYNPKQRFYFWDFWLLAVRRFLKEQICNRVKNRKKELLKE